MTKMRLAIAGFEDGRVPGARECRQPAEAAKGGKMS